MPDDAVFDIGRSDVTIACPDGSALPGYFVRPVGGEARPALVMVFEAFGMNAEMKRIADTFAAAGFPVVLPDLMARGSWVSCVVRLFGDVRRGTGKGVDDLLAARAFLADSPAVDGDRVGIIGFCLGGGFALVLAKSGHFKVAAPFYGQVPADLTGVCPVVASYGANDRPFARQVPHLTAELERIGVPNDVKVYDDAGHSFMSDAPNRVIGSLMRLTGAGHNPAAAKDATERVLAFLATHL